MNKYLNSSGKQSFPPQPYGHTLQVSKKNNFNMDNPNDINSSKEKFNMPNPFYGDANNQNNMNNMNFNNMNSMGQNNMNFNNMNNMGQNNINFNNMNNMGQNNMNLNNMNNMGQNNMNLNNMNNMGQNNMNNNNMFGNTMMANNIGMGINLSNTNSQKLNMNNPNSEPNVNKNFNMNNININDNNMNNINLNNMNNMNNFNNNQNEINNMNINNFDNNNLNNMNNLLLQNINNNMNIQNNNMNQIGNNNNNNNNNDQNLLNNICNEHSLRLSKYYDYNPSEATCQINSLLKDMDNYGELIKKKIIQEKNSNPNKFISVEEALSISVQNNINNNQNNMGMNMGMGMGMPNSNNPKNDFFVLSLLKLALQSEGCTCEIERDIAKNVEDENEGYTGVQFLVNGMYKYKKYILSFDLGEEKNSLMITDLTLQGDFNKRLLIALKGLFKLTEKDIILVNPRNSPYIISVIIKKSSFNELTDIQLFNSLKSNQDFDTIVKVEKTILLNGIKLNRKMLDFRGDRYEGWGVNELRGGKPYNPPIGWNGYGIRVWERYDYGDNTWLDYNNTPGEWSVAYHGFGSSLSGNSKFVISPDNNNLLNTIIRQEFKNNNDKYHQGKTVGEGVYMTQFPNVLEKYCSEYACQGKKYKIGFMCRVMPDKIRCPENNDDFWIINGTDNEVRPYRILIKEVV